MSMEYEISIRLKGIDDATPTFKDVTSAIIEMRKGNDVARQSFNELYKEVREQQKIIRVLKEEASGAGLTFEVFKDTLNKFGNVMSGVNSIMTRWNLLQTRLNTAQIALNQAQRDYNEAVERFGPNSEQARKALERLHEAQKKMNQTQIETIFQMTALGINAITLVPKFMELYKSLSALIAVKKIAAATSAQLAAAQTASAAAGAASVPGHLAAAGGITAVGTAAAAASKPLAIFKALLGPPGWALLAGAAVAVTAFFATVGSQSVAAERSLTSFQSTTTGTFTAVASEAEIMASSVSTSFEKMGQTLKISGQEFASYADYISDITYKALKRIEEINAQMQYEYERSIPWYAGRYGAEAQLMREGRWNELASMQRAGSTGGWGFNVEELRRYGTPIPIEWYSSLASLRQYFYGKTEITYEEMLKSSPGALQAQIDYIKYFIRTQEKTLAAKYIPAYREELEKLERALSEVTRRLEEEQRRREAERQYKRQLEEWVERKEWMRVLGILPAVALPTTPKDWIELAKKYSGIQPPSTTIVINNLEVKADDPKKFLDKLTEIASLRGEAPA
ncbi:MAG: hypothetical protein LZ159_00070 [Thaumarchaeota archaeon]|nr:hypothetical protein [Candidatus Terraquivivens yellowstonensis]